MKRQFLHPALINYENQMTDFLEQQKKPCRYCFARGCQGQCLVRTFAPELETKVEPPAEAPRKRFSLYGLLALLAVWWFVAWFVVQILEGYQ